MKGGGFFLPQRGLAGEGSGSQPFSWDLYVDVLFLKVPFPPFPLLQELQTQLSFLGFPLSFLGFPFASIAQGLSEPKPYSCLISCFHSELEWLSLDSAFPGHLGTRQPFTLFRSSRVSQFLNHQVHWGLV